MAYLLIIKAVNRVALPAAAFVSVSPSATAPVVEWSPADRCSELLGQLASHVEDIQEFSSAGNSPARMFMCRARRESDVEAVLHSLALNCGIGNEDTPACGSVSVLTLELARPTHVKGPAEPRSDAKPASRVLADKVLLRILAGSTVSFDYYVLVCMASLLATLGLATNNTVVIVAAMLVSPLMGPILGITFGMFVADKSLFWRSFLAEAQGLLLCCIVGFASCAVLSPFASALQWPTFEMTSRGETWGLILGIAIAVPSGAGVALSITGDNASSLVGVAISASLLPPMVNAGMCWMLSIATATYAPSLSYDAHTFAMMGLNSMALTLVNIIGIVFGAIIVFRIKETAPLPSRGALFESVTRNLRQTAFRPTTVAPMPQSDSSNTSRVGNPISDNNLYSDTSQATIHAFSGATFATVAARRLAGVTTSTKMSLAEAIEMMQANQARGAVQVNPALEKHLKISGLPGSPMARP